MTYLKIVFIVSDDHMISEKSIFVIADTNKSY